MYNFIVSLTCTLYVFWVSSGVVGWKIPLVTDTIQHVHQIPTPQPTNPPESSSTYIQRRQNPGLQTCGYLSGRTDSIVACSSDLDCVFYTPATLAPNAQMGCCPNDNIYDCNFITACLNYPLSSIHDPNILSCVPPLPYCLSYTVPAVDATGYGCDATSNTGWQTISLFNSNSTISINTIQSPSGVTSEAETPFVITSPTEVLPGAPSSSVASTAEASSILSTTLTISSTSTGLTSPGSPNPGSPSPGAPGPIQDLTSSQKAGIGAGCSAVSVLAGYALYVMCLRRSLQGKPEPQETIDEAGIPHTSTIGGTEKGNLDTITHNVSEPERPGTLPTRKTV